MNAPATPPGRDRQSAADGFDAHLRPDRRLDWSVKWSLGLFLVSFPLMLVWLVLITQFVAGLEVSLEDSPAAQRIANAVYVLLVLSTLLAACAVGAYGWFRRRLGAALAVAVLAATTAAAFVVLPALAG